MFDVLSKDLFKAPLPYAEINGTDVFATKVKLTLALPWLEVVCGERGEEEIFLLGDSREYAHFADEAVAQKVASIACRALERSSGKLVTIELSRVVILEDGISVRYGTAEGWLLDPLTLKRDRGGERKFEKVLFEVNAERRRAPKSK